MITEEIKNEIRTWIRKKLNYNDDGLLEIAIHVIREMNLNWNSPTGKKKLKAALKEYQDPYPKEKPKKGFKQPQKGNRELADKSVIDGNNDDCIDPTNTLGYVAPNKPTKHNGFQKNAAIREHLPFEINELLKEIDDNAYQSKLLANLDQLGRLKLIRQAAILTYQLKKMQKE